MSDTLYRESDCDHAGWRATKSGHPQCLDCGGLLLYVVPVDTVAVAINDAEFGIMLNDGKWLNEHGRYWLIPVATGGVVEDPEQFTVGEGT